MISLFSVKHGYYRRMDTTEGFGTQGREKSPSNLAVFMKCSCSNFHNHYKIMLHYPLLKMKLSALKIRNQRFLYEFNENRVDLSTVCGC